MEREGNKIMESRKYTNFVIIHNFKLVIKGTIKINKQMHLQKKPNKNKPNQTIKRFKKNYNLKYGERTFFFESHSVVSDSLWQYTVHGILQAWMLEWIAFFFSRGSSQPRDWTQVSRIAGGYFTSWATRENQVYWSYRLLGSLSLLQQIFSTKELNWGLLHCGRILYQLSYQGEELRASESVWVR